MNSTLYLWLKALVLPPGVLVATAAFGYLMGLRFPRLGRAIVASTLLGLWLLSTPWATATLAREIEIYPPLQLADLAGMKLDAIVVLGGGANRDAPEFGGYDDVSRLTLERLRYAARLHRATGIEVAVTGGKPAALRTAEGAMMRAVLEKDFRVPVRWAETESNNTAENARLSADRFPYRNIILVTHAVHMPRAMRAFTDAGFSAVPAPLGYISRTDTNFSLYDLMPNMESLHKSYYVIYEAIGALWYRWFNNA